MASRSFVIPRQIYYGTGALQNLSTVTGQKAFIVTDPGVRALGLVERTETILQKINIKTAVFYKVEPDPSRDLVWSIFSQVQDFKPDIIVSIGGGSSIDAGKTAWLLYEHPDLAKLPFLDFLRQASTRELRKKAIFIAIATTSGTGSEVTSAAVVTDRSVNPPYKAGFGSKHLVPDIAIADPELAASMPPDVTANTGFDAFIHAIECYIFTQPSDMVDPIAIWSANTSFKWLPIAYADGKNMLAREKMHTASLQAGIAFSNGRLGLVHGLAHEIGGTFHIPHGRANAFMLCHVFAFLYASKKDRMISLADHLGISGQDDSSKVNNLLTALDKLKDKVGIPLAIKNSGLDKNLFMGQLDAISNDYMNQIARSPATGKMNVEERRLAGIPYSADQVKELFLNAWNGTSIKID